MEKIYIYGWLDGQKKYMNKMDGWMDKNGKKQMDGQMD